ncbi:hypothetical protein LTR62_006011 [Meristemomyces frigidus]|uniref:Scavenger mRNA decapping enzyme n=1 Tax=Meristemomyces frigidus TaxID=1508187 RepID=A0AAN7THJ9_9PEZI|nr:hypothetical protein LTR62_006011 [Meristemomyces frigidus]
MASPSMSANSMLTRFKFAKLLRQDQGGRRIILEGTISGQPALLLAERGNFDTNPAYLSAFGRLMVHVNNLGDNDIYHWYLANSLPDNSADQPTPPDLKINLIYPCTDKHIKKYRFQRSRFVTETPEIYVMHVRPYMQRAREEGRLNWVFNIIDGKSEQENVLYRSAEARVEDDYLLLPDLNWDRKTIGSLHLLALVVRRDIWTVRDLTKRDVAWLRKMRAVIAQQVSTMYEGLEGDTLKFYIHYQPTYYHFHIHVVHVDLEPAHTQGVGKAMGLDNVISQLDTISGGEAAGMQDVELSYTVGEASELWTEIYLPLKEV